MINDKKKVFGYIRNDNYNFLLEMKEEIYNRDHLKSSMSKLIELALIELKENNDLLSIEKKLMKNDLI